MTYTSTARLLVGQFVCVLMLAACSKDPCFPGSSGKLYRIKIVELWDVNSRFPGATQLSADCPVDLDLKPGTSFVIQVDRFSQDEGPGCVCGTGPAMEAPDGWTWQGVGTPTCQANFFELRTEGLKGACSASVAISINASRVPTGAGVPGQPPLAYLQRRFQPRGTTCSPAPTTCSDQYVVEIVEL